ncbi:hypothetical protein FRC11_011224 [Ceratobasidium sp. 423]|nr:hypothetical protein FRC11_011224 [Ceratobasidium sp. 423]
MSAPAPTTFELPLSHSPNTSAPQPTVTAPSAESLTKWKWAYNPRTAPPYDAEKHKQVLAQIAALKTTLDVAESVPPTLKAPEPTAPQQSSSSLACGELHFYLNSNGGLTGTLCGHLIEQHPALYYAKCLEAGLTECLVSSGISAEVQPDFSHTGLTKWLVKWTAVDDQVPNIVKCLEFQDLLLYCGQNKIKEANIPHRNKLARAAWAMYLLEKQVIDAELKVGCITLDNATKNNSMMEELAKAFEAQGWVFDAKENQIQQSAKVFHDSAEGLINDMTEAYLQALKSDPIELCCALITAC